MIRKRCWRAQFPPGDRAALSLAGLGGRREGHHGRRADCLHQPGRGRPPGREARAGLFAYLRGLQGRERRRPARRDRKCLPRRRQPHDQWLPAARCDQQGQRNPLPRRRRYTRLAHLYESMLREMRDAAGELGEFYTPRPVVRFMVEVVDPRLGETILDPACGTGGFLVEAFNHLRSSARP